jgi:hypothetical protein
MTQPAGNCPGCGADEPFEQVHPGYFADDRCPDPDPGGECPEWVCPGCGAGVFMGTVTMGIFAASAAGGTVTAARRSFRAA